MNINKELTKIETCFNIAGSIPLVGFFSGAFRIVTAKIQFIAGTVFALAGLIGQIFNSNLKKFEVMTQSGVEQVLQGLLNGFRGLGEMMLGATIFGSLAFLGYQTMSENKFAPIFKYKE